MIPKQAESLGPLHITTPVPTLPTGIGKPGPSELLSQARHRHPSGIRLSNSRTTSPREELLPHLTEKETEAHRGHVPCQVLPAKKLWTQIWT